MSDMSAGQIVGGVLGGVVGFFMGGPVGAFQGAALGMGVGGYIDPPPGPNLKGPTLDDKTFQSAAYGVALPRLYGTIATMGNIIYLENNEYKAVSKKEKQGGKGGGGGGTYETTTYYATVAIALAEALPGSSVRRIWAGGKLIYSAGSDDLGTILQSNKNASGVNPGWRYYDGTQTEPDSRMEASLGVGQCPSYEGTAYIIFYDFDLTEYGNGLAGCPFKVEIASGQFVGDEHYGILDTYDTASGGSYSVGCTGVFLGGDKFEFMPAFWPGFFETATTATGDVVTGDLDYWIMQFPEIKDIYKGQRNRVYKGVNTQSQGWYSYVRGVMGDDGLGEKLFLASPNGEIEFGEIGALFSQEVGHVVHVGGGMGASYYSAAEPLSPRAYSVYVYGAGFIGVAKDDFPAFGFTPDGLTVVVDADSNAAGTISRTIDIYDGNDFVRSFNVVLPYVNGLFSVLFTGNILNLFSVPTKDGVQFWQIDIQTEVLLKTGFVEFGLDSLVTGGSGVFNNIIMGNYGNLFCVAAPRSGGGSRFVYFTLNPDGPGGILYRAPLDEIVISYLSGAGVDDYDVSALAGIYIDGYRVDGVASARAALAPLQTQNLFDLRETGYGVDCCLRGSLSVATISFDEFVVKDGTAIKVSREQESLLPTVYKLSYLDYNREYDSGEQVAVYPGVHSNTRQEQLAVVMTAQKAAQTADVLCGLAWIERDNFTFTLPQTYLGLKVSDVITVEVSPGIYRELRINSASHNQDQAVSISAKSSSYAVYTSSAEGIDVDPPPETIKYIGESYSVLMDIPMLAEQYQNTHGFVVAMYGRGDWPGGVMLASGDEGQTYAPKSAFYDPGTVAQVAAPLNADDCFVIDRSGSLVISVKSGSFYSITEEQMLTGKHYCAYGNDQRWEIIQYAHATENENSVTLSILVRGLFGTEWAATLHEAGDYLVLLDDPDNQFINLPPSVVGVPQAYKSVTVGKNIADVSPQQFSYAGVNLKPLSVVNVTGERNIDGDFSVVFFARTRYGSNFWVTGSQPQNEPALLFEIDVLDGDSVVRTISTTTTSFVYSADDQLADFGSLPAEIDFNIYQISAVVGRGYVRAITL